MIRTICLVAVFAVSAAASCSKSNDKGGKKNLDINAECHKMFGTLHKPGADAAKFVAACEKHSKRSKNYNICLRADAPKSYCDKGMSDPVVKAEIAAMKAALGQ